MTAAELEELIDGYIWRDEREMHRTAWLAANLMNMWRGKGASRVTPEKLLGPKRKKRGAKPAASEDHERQSALAAVKAIVNPDQAKEKAGMVISEAAWERVWHQSQARAKLTKERPRRSGSA